MTRVTMFTLSSCREGSSAICYPHCLVALHTCKLSYKCFSWNHQISLDFLFAFTHYVKNPKYACLVEGRWSSTSLVSSKRDVTRDFTSIILETPVLCSIPNFNLFKVQNINDGRNFPRKAKVIIENVHTCFIIIGQYSDAVETCIHFDYQLTK